MNPIMKKRGTIPDWIDMTAHVGDSGLVNLLFEASNNPSKSQSLLIGLKGSIGYIPPEYEMGGQVSPLGDIYSYRILLLEMFNGKRPIDDVQRWFEHSQIRCNGFARTYHGYS
ncbi:hypothetical protein CMV_018929 [Castanea mollissima]|uniref:Protein kinase domain-containing protein n=1 Tax=Castanea mollissima TaxID=60419 RepID=A0A8J4R3X4_9ROSI|nr:hypothetical protein CMV_018929 [Castanea mollissima]